MKMKHLFSCQCLEFKAICKVKTCLFDVDSMFSFVLEGFNKGVYALTEITHFSRNHTFLFSYEESPLPGEEINTNLAFKIKVIN